MWLPSLIKQLMIEKEMQNNGFQLTAEDIYSVNQSSMKDAVVWFNRGCTGEVISDQGLVLTNHHCGYGQIQSHSTVENDYLKDGFAAKNHGEELPNNNMKVSFIVEIKDVTKEVLTGVTDAMTEEERQQLIKENTEKLQGTAVEGTHYEASIKPFFYGNAYYMFIMETFTDVRLVFAPPSSIGKFGGDTDNWMWPRHTGDFSVFRIYADKDNKPAAYSPDNVPYKPRHHFPISLDGVKPEDFTMVYGFPGRTQQYIPSYGVKYVTEVSNPVKISMRDASLSVIDKAMKSDDLIRIKYSAKQARIANAWKKWIGESKGLDRLDAVTKKQTQEAAFQQAVKGNAQYENLLKDFERAYAEIEPYNLARDLFIEFYYYGPEIFRMSSRYDKLVTNYKELYDKGKLAELVLQLKQVNEDFYKDYDKGVDQKIFDALVGTYVETVAPVFLADHLNEAHKKGELKKLENELYQESVFADKERLNELMKPAFEAAEKGDQKALKKAVASISKEMKKDIAWVTAGELVLKYRQEVAPAYGEKQEQINALMQDYVKGTMEVFDDKKYWSDANSTMRVTFGKVEGSNPRDGVEYLPYTTLEGVMEKRRTDVSETHEFYVPEKLVELYNNKDYGIYGQDGDLVVCFTASNHTTGGNSGSPVINGNGQLIGLNFDRTWESTMSDIMFDPVKCRNISVDIRYVLFIIDKFGGAKHLIDEMTLIKN
ncbi:S46 family peptidase [Algivirga pacifica]|uniref:Dipeptidyl-peptidase n=2 Tax=Algivirga pacifica TaxID=1162670 RepID=A0ABP9DD12_9BACT